MLCRWRQNALLDRQEQIVQRFLCRVILCAKRRQRRAFRIELFFHRLRDVFDQIIVKDDLPCHKDHSVLDPALADAFLVAAAMMLHADAFVIAVRRSVFGRAAFSCHVASTLPAKQLCGQQILLLCLVPGRGFFICRHAFLYPVEQLLRNDCRDAAGLDDISVSELADISAVVQHSSDAIDIHLAAAIGANPLQVHLVDNLTHARAGRITLKGLQHDWRGNRIDLIELVLVDHIAEGRRPAVEFALQRVFRHAAVDLLCQFRRVVLRHAFQNRFQQDTLRAFRNGLRGGHDPDAVSPQHGFVMGGVVAISGKAIQLPDENDIKRSAAAFFDHLLKLRAVVCLRGICPVNIGSNDLNIILFRERPALPELTFNGFFPLIVRGIAGIDDCFHSASLPFC